MAKFDLQVASKQKKSLALDPVVVLVLLIQSIPDVYEGIEPFMLEPGVTGNKGADRAITVWTLMKIISDLADVGDAKAIELMKLPFDRLKTLLPHALRRIGLDVRNGKVFGYLTDGTAEETAAPAQEELDLA
jgi:hypothetical protein